MIQLDDMSIDDLKNALESFVSDAFDNYREAGEGIQDDFQAGRQLAYYEVLDMIRSRIMINNGKMDDVDIP